MDKTYRTGTHRCRHPEQTMAALTPVLPDWGITRIADVTGLDHLRIPVAVAHRPAAATLTVSQGKGATLAAAKVSAAMEAIETAAAEDHVPPPALTAPAAELDLDYDVTMLTEDPRSLLTSHSIIDWIAASTTSGRPAMIPRDLVTLGRRPRAGFRLITASSNGLASGNTRDEAVAHALFELIERDACAGLPRIPAGELAVLDLDTVPPGWPSDMIGRITAGGGRLQVIAVPTRFGVPCYAAWLQAEDAPWLAGGAGAHSDPEVALSRAVTEAAQSRLTVIAGTRDDLAPALYQSGGLPAPFPGPARPTAGWGEQAAGLGWSCGTDTADAAIAAQRITEVTGTEPLVADLAAQAEFCVVKVVCPGLRFTPWRLLQLGSEAA